MSGEEEEEGRRISISYFALCGRVEAAAHRPGYNLGRCGGNFVFFILFIYFKHSSEIGNYSWVMEALL